MIGYGFMGAAHSHAWRTVGRVFDLPLTPRMRVLCGRTRSRLEDAAAKLGWDEAETDWRQAVVRQDIDLVDICTPGEGHAEIAQLALAAGKHVLCEKPLANTVAQAEAMTRAASHAPPGTVAMVGFTYRRVPALAFAHQLVAEGRIGRVRHVRAVYLQDWIVDPRFPLVWRLRREVAGSGALGDIGAHIVDLAEWLIGERIGAVSGLTETFVRERPLPAGSVGLTAEGSTRELGKVTVDDAALFLARFPGGAVGTFEATRFATGRKNGLRIELNGELGSLAFELERLDELELYEDSGRPETRGFRRILVTEPAHPYLSAWWPPGHILGWEHAFTHQVRDLVIAVADGRLAEPTFADGLHVQRVLDAVEDSARQHRWVDLPAVRE